MGYNIGTMFWYKAIFMAELIVAETLLAYRFRFRSLFWLRLLGAGAGIWFGQGNPAGV